MNNSDSRPSRTIAALAKEHSVWNPWYEIFIVFKREGEIDLGLP